MYNFGLPIRKVFDDTIRLDSDIQPSQATFSVKYMRKQVFVGDGDMSHRRFLLKRSPGDNSANDSWARTRTVHQKCKNKTRLDDFLEHVIM